MDVCMPYWLGGGVLHLKSRAWHGHLDASEWNWMAGLPTEMGCVHLYIYIHIFIYTPFSFGVSCEWCKWYAHLLLLIQINRKLHKRPIDHCVECGGVLKGLQLNRSFLWLNNTKSCYFAFFADGGILQHGHICKYNTYMYNSEFCVGLFVFFVRFN